MVHTEIQASITKTAAFTGSGVDVSALGLDWTLKIQVQQLAAGVIARFEFDDTTNSFTTTAAGPVTEFLGDIESSFDHVRSFKRNQFPGLAVGISGAKLRLVLSQLGAPGTVTYHAWLET